MAGFSGSFPHDLLDLNDWRWQGPVKDDGSLGKEGDGKAVSVPGDVADTEEMEKYVDDPWFTLVSEGDGGAVRAAAVAGEGGDDQQLVDHPFRAARDAPPRRTSASPHGTRPAPRSTT